LSLPAFFVGTVEAMAEVGDNLILVRDSLLSRRLVSASEPTA